MAEFIGFNGMDEASLRMFFAQTFTQGSFMQARDGVIGATGLGVTQTTTASVSVLVDAGMGIVQSTTLGGAIPLLNPAAKTLDVLTANPMGGTPRNDIVVFDSATATIRAIIGTPNAVPTDPTVPSTAVPLARLRHAASATTIPTAKIDDLRVWISARGGITTVADQTDRDTLFARAGTAAFRQDTNATETYDGSTWRVGAQASAGKAGKRLHWGTYSSTDVNRSDATGIETTIAHGAGFTPTTIVISPNSIALQFRAFNLTSTTFDIQVINSDGSANGTSTFGFSYLVGE